MDEGPFVFLAIFPFLMPLLMIGVVILIFVLSFRAARKRRAAAQAYAAGRGWTYTQQVPLLTERWRGSPFGVGRGRSASNVLTGLFHGRQIVSFDYRYTTGSGKNRQTHNYHVLALNLPAALPWLQLTPDGMGASIAKFFGGQDIEFESQAFNEAWRVKAPPGQYAYDVIHPRMMDRLLAPDALGQMITIEGNDILLAVSGYQSLERIDYHLNLLYGLVELIPRHVWLRVGHDPLAARA